VGLGITLRHWCGMLCLAGTWLLLPNSAAAQGGCPPNSEPHQEFRQGNTITVRCRCIRGYTEFHQQCRAKPEVEAALRERALHAAEGARHAATTINYEAGRLSLLALKDKSGDIITAAVALAARQPKFAAGTLAALPASIFALVSDVRGCTASEDIRIACDNLRIFQKILAETETDLRKLEAP